VARARTAKVGGIAAAALCFGAGLLAGTAGAEVKQYPSTVHMHAIGPDPDYDHWVGDVHSRKAKCEPRRRVAVIYNETPDPEVVGSDRTDRFGHWQVPINVLGVDDPYHAVVRRKVIDRGGDKIVCQADRSPDFGLP
jgi:hypothetical protein